MHEVQVFCQSGKKRSREQRDIYCIGVVEKAHTLPICISHFVDTREIGYVFSLKHSVNIILTFENGFTQKKNTLG